MEQENITVRELTAELVARPGAPLKFYFDESSINPGYHVTEVRYAVVNSLDCGKGNDQWDEVTIQLLDGSAKSTQGYMSTSKFIGIVGTAMKELAADTSPFLFFEFAPGNGPIRKLSIETIEQDGKEVSVFLGSEQAVCKPFQRSKAAKAAKTLSGRAAVQSSTQGCCSDDRRSEGSTCCG